MNLSNKVKSTIKENNLTLINEAGETKRDMTLNSHYFFKACNGDLWQAQTDFDVFYKMPNQEYIDKIIEVMQANNISRKKTFDIEYEKQFNARVIALFLKGIYGDTLPARKMIATVKKYIHSDVLLEYANGRRGYDGLCAQRAFFKTKAFALFITAIK